MKKHAKKARSKWWIWEKFWKEIEPLLPKVVNRHRFGGGRPRVSDKRAMEGFYVTVQNKLHWAIHGHTAAEIIKNRADAGNLNMGLTN